MDYSYDAQIVNNSPQQIRVLITYDRKKLDSIYAGQTYYPYLQSIGQNPKTPLARFDSVGLIAEYIVPGNENLRIEDGIGGWDVAPNYMLIKEITIRSNTNLTTYPHNRLYSAFKRIRRGAWELQIK